MGSSSPETSFAPEAYSNRRDALSKKIEDASANLNPAQREAYKQSLDAAFMKDKLGDPKTAMEYLNSWETGFDTNLKDIAAKNEQKRVATQELFNMQKNSNQALTDPQKRIASFVAATGAKSPITNSILGTK